MNSRLALAALLGMASLGGACSYRYKTEPEEKPCLLCGKLKQHNNSFCSAECCKRWKNGERQDKERDGRKPVRPIPVREDGSSEV